ncbi:uncharacterized protein LOC130664166 [Microplitis mediator]|uniref:uncharacterized protein LOC130664166 n=1 Tax=Microplitis mediator TaxID=375433 RepID=UPI002557B10C|nr:uncharacterized protein LOC130664166 [Microplitis mediator]
MQEWFAVKLKIGDDDRWEAIPVSWLIKNNGHLTGFCWWMKNACLPRQPLPATLDKLWEQVAILSKDMFGFNTEVEARENVYHLNLMKNLTGQVKVSHDLCTLKILLHNKEVEEKYRTELQYLLPIQTIEEFKKFEERLAKEPKLSAELVKLFKLLTNDKNLRDSSWKILNAIFERNVIIICSWDGSYGTLALRDSHTIKLINEFFNNFFQKFDLARAVTEWSACFRL